ncbi:MAG: hypothetical protein JEZ08_10335 [Clostridiales bacterium]|nr:hypothetical protein [Clostridiales bacterium]
MAITLKQKHRVQTIGQNDQAKSCNLSYHDFIELHSDFIREKQLENLSPRTINDHIMLFGYFVKWLKSTHWFGTDQGIQKALFLDYKEYMMDDKKYAPCTINIRLRPIKAYITWLFSSKHISINYNNFIKLVKVSDNRMQPLSKTEIRKLLDSIGTETYARFRDLALSIMILDCGIRTTEALTLTIHDINFKDSFIIVQTSK